MEVNVRELRARLSYYLDKLEEGEEITIIRRSRVIGKITPLHKRAKKVEAKHPASGVTFRQYQSSDMEAVRQLHEQALRATGAFGEGPKAKELDRDLDNIEGYYLHAAGEFLVGELQGAIVAMGAIRMTAEEGQAELKKMRVRPDLQGQGIGSQLLKLLEDRARSLGYRALVLDTTVKQAAAQKFYLAHAYQETSRRKDGQFELIFYKKEL